MPNKPNPKNYLAFNLQFKRVFQDSFKTDSQIFHVILISLFLDGLKIVSGVIKIELKAVKVLICADSGILIVSWHSSFIFRKVKEKGLERY